MIFMKSLLLSFLKSVFLLIYIYYELFQTEAFNDDNRVGGKEKCFKTFLLENICLGLSSC